MAATPVAAEDHLPAAPGKKWGRRVLLGLSGLTLVGLGGTAAHVATEPLPGPLNNMSVVQRWESFLNEKDQMPLRRIKNLDDWQAHQIDFKHPIDISLADFIKLHPTSSAGYSKFAPRGMVGPFEFHVYRITAHAESIDGWSHAQHGDGDMSINLYDNQGHTLHVESPDPHDIAFSPYAKEMIHGRQQMEALAGGDVQGKKDLHGEMVTITGVGFWDSGHSGWMELHPVLSVEKTAQQGPHVAPPTIDAPDD